ncbi:hypothetical protein DXI23_04770 [Marinobacter flavimaris]|uniref:Replication origin-binding protein domain-containing protein n=1 Tax=Marinobacter flavimaris TaxID=262076 RepID=A0A3D8H4Q4_9GAMM|nr:hypothetical protein [Marinobacter flavimaris]PPI81188.1 hypothetical protein MDHKLMBL_03670 [Marinobacter flavimaris]RDU41640.1 hypothetical protein DXI23_04770 [Marinobacter flavimaris]
MIITKDFASELSEALQDQRLSGIAQKITLKSSQKDTDVIVVEQALWSRSVAELSSGAAIDFGKLDGIEAATIFVDVAAGTPFQAKSVKAITKAILKKWSVDFFEDGLTELASRLPLNLVRMIRETIKQRESEVRSFHTTSFPFETVDKYHSMYKSISCKCNKLFVLNGAMGSRKTHALREIYTKAREAGQFPMMITGKRSIASNFFPADHADHYQTTSKEDAQGLVGVINTLASNRHYGDRARCKVVLIDEVEDLFDHMASGTLGITYADRVTAMDRLASLIRGAEKVVVADAMITDASIRKLAKMAGEDAKIIKAEGANDVNLKVVKESEVIALAREDMQAGKKVAVFCDYRAEKFADVAHSIREKSGKDVIELTAKYLEERGKSLDDIEEILKASDAAIISPVINAGASIELEEYDRVYVLAGRTLAPTSVLQSVRRFRAAKTAYIAFRGGRSEQRITQPKAIIFDQIKRDAESPADEMLRLFDTKSGRFLAQHAARRNQQFKSFKQTVLIAAEQMGFTVEHTELSASQRKAGTKAKAAGRRKTEDVRSEIAFDTSKKKHAGRDDLIDFGTDEAPTFKQETAARTFDAMELLEIKELDEQSYAEIFSLDIDYIVARRKKLCSAADFGRRDQIASFVAARFMSACGFDFDDVAGSQITKEKAEAAFEELSKPVALETGSSMSGIELIKMAFPSINFRKKHKTQIFKDLVKALGYDMTAGGYEGKTRIYVITSLIRKIGGEQVNVTELADFYVVPKPDLEVTTHVMGSLTPVTAEELMLQQQIDRKAFQAMIEMEAERAEMLCGTTG